MSIKFVENLVIYFVIIPMRNWILDERICGTNWRVEEFSVSSSNNGIDICAMISMFLSFLDLNIFILSRFHNIISEERGHSFLSAYP